MESNVGNPVSLFTKVVSSPLEIELQEIAANYEFAPRIHQVNGNIVQMDKINGNCLADIYTDDPEMVPEKVWNDIHRILVVLFECEGIEYIDITSYNFVLEKDSNKVWIIDFGHAQYTKKSDGIPENWFLCEALDGSKTWNPDFA